jgi:hypothetical protein
MSDAPANISPTLPIEYASPALVSAPTRATRVILLVWILTLFVIGTMEACVCVAEGDLQTPLSPKASLCFVALGDSVAMGIAMFALAVRRPSTWPIAYGLCLAAAIPPLLAVFVAVLLSLSVFGSRWTLNWFQEVFILSILSILIWVNLGLAMYLTRPQSRWAFKAEVLKTPTAKHATWIVGALWALLILVPVVMSAL